MKDKVEEILGLPVTTLVPLSRGGNSRVFRAETNDGAFLVKVYRDDDRPRLATESLALDQLAAVNAVVPKFYGSSENIAVHEWIRGTPVSNPSDRDCDAVVELVAKAQTVPSAEAFGPASAACLSLSDAAVQVSSRLEDARSIEVEPVRAFVQTELEPIVARELAQFSARPDVKEAERILSPSDLGFHNAIRRPSGELVFCDFEYFGWDDPAKLIADTWLHPAMEPWPDARRRIALGLRQFLDDDRRLELGYPLWALCWVMIVLNPFLPGRAAPKNAVMRDTRLTEARRRLADVGSPWQLWTTDQKS